MFTVTYTYYKSYKHEKSFKTYQAAKGFFNVISRKANVTQTEIRATSDRNPSMNAKLFA
jgi:hypothetical protein